MSRSIGIKRSNYFNWQIKRFKITYFALPVDEGNDKRYAVYKTVQSWIQVVGDDTGSWTTDCAECYVEQKIRDHVVDMEFVPLNKAGLKMFPLPSPGTNAVARDNLYKIKAIGHNSTITHIGKCAKYQ